MQKSATEIRSNQCDFVISECDVQTSFLRFHRDLRELEEATVCLFNFCKHRIVVADAVLEAVIGGEQMDGQSIFELLPIVVEHEPGKRLEAFAQCARELMELAVELIFLFDRCKGVHVHDAAEIACFRIGGDAMTCEECVRPFDESGGLVFYTGDWYHVYLVAMSKAVIVPSKEVQHDMAGVVCQPTLHHGFV